MSHGEGAAIEVDLPRIAKKDEEKAIKLYQDMLAAHPDLRDLLDSLISENKDTNGRSKKISELTRS